MSERSNLHRGACRLCLQQKQLRHSHLLSAALYRFMREPSEDNPDPIFVTPGQSRQTSDQIRDHLFCGECEDRFSKGGETWVLRNCYRASGEFQLHRYVHETPISHGQGRLAASVTASNPKIRIDKLAYFAASVFWRASINDWRLRGQPMNLPNLGTKYDEEFRMYLLGERELPFDAVLCIGITKNETPPLICTFPVGGRVEAGYYSYSFWIPGLSFDLFLGKRMPNAIRAICSVRTPGQLLYISDRYQEKLLAGAVPLIRKSKPTLKLERKYGV